MTDCKPSIVFDVVVGMWMNVTYSSKAALFDSFRAHGSLFHLSFPLQLSVMQTTSIAKCSCTIRAAAPFGSIDSVAAMATSWRGSSATSFFYFAETVMLLHAIPVHGNIIVLVWRSGFATFAGFLVGNAAVHDFPNVVKSLLQVIRVV